MATAQSLREAVPTATAVAAFSAGNLADVAKAVRSLNAAAEIIVCGDDDPAGRKGGEAAATAVNGRMVLPDGVNDFNDLHQAQGLPAVRQAILGAEENEDWRADLIIHHKRMGPRRFPVGCIT